MCVSMYLHTCTYIYVCMYVCRHPWTDGLMYVYIHTYIYIYAYIYIYIYIYIHMCIYKHTYIYTYFYRKNKHMLFCIHLCACANMYQFPINVCYCGYLNCKLRVLLKL